MTIASANVNNFINNKLLIIADDFTGALDTGVQFSKKGIASLVLTVDQLSFEAGYTADVLVINTESRHLSPQRAYDLIYNVTSRALKHGFKYFYKKTDSALRGNIGAELAGLLEASGENSLTFVPAFPQNRRVTRSGIQYIDGVEVAQSVFSVDPFSPVKHSSVAEIIHLQAGLPTENLTRAAYAQAAVKPETKTIRIMDAESVEDLAAIGAHLKEGQNLNLLSGCAGFAEILPDLLMLPKREFKLAQVPSTLLVVSGSVNPIAIEQLAFGEFLGFATYTLTKLQKLEPLYPQSEAGQKYVAELAEQLNICGRVIVRAVKDTSEIAFIDDYIDSQNDSLKEISKQIASNISQITCQILKKSKVGTLVIFGGDTLHGILAQMNSAGVIPLAEISSGVVAAKVLTDQHDGLVITKSGGLSGPNILRSIEEFVFKNGGRQ
ncbi:MAG: four-carbon acid sugar kinase family protein [Deltaproteobacteria bacterium]|jgi:uncharacterized protein YgbK (DUF1537 family)|nr:four-carbon acid sugar kinase family protein [Deltaproteobacteria bacterium]